MVPFCIGITKGSEKELDDCLKKLALEQKKTYTAIPSKMKYGSTSRTLKRITRVNGRCQRSMIHVAMNIANVCD
jgi:hypothetical protein